MKKTLFLAVLAGAALAGCVKNEEAVKSDTSPERIKFEAPVVGVPVRATEIYGNYPGNKDFAVWALYHQDAYDADAFNSPVYYMEDVTCTADNTSTPTTWNPAGEYYWPKNGYLTFAAYAPSSANATWDVNGFKFTDFTVNATPADQIDLLYSERQYDKQSGSVVSDQPYDGVTIPFKHALSSIVFMAKAADGSSVEGVKLTGITVYNVAYKGTFKQNLLAEKSGDTDENTETDKDNEPAWEIADADDTNGDGTPDGNGIPDYTTSYTVFTSNDGKTLTTTAEPVNGALEDENNPTYNSGDIPNSSANNNDGVRRSDLIVIPQVLNGRATNDKNVKVTITYKIKQGTEWFTDSTDFQMSTGPVTDKKYVWEMGKRYIYTIEIGLNKISFNPQVLNWEDVSSDFTQI